MNRYKFLYYPRDVGLAPRPGDLRTMTVDAIDARRAARIAATYERRTGARVLTVREEGK